MAELRRASLLVLALSGCGGCDDGRNVPFKRDETPAPGAIGATKDAAAGEPAADAFVPNKGRTHPEGTRRIDVGDDVIEIDAGSLRASLEVDLDADGDLDVLFVGTGDDGTLSLSRAERSAKGLSTPEHRAALGKARPDCAIETAELERFAPGFVAVRSETRCRLTVRAEEAAASAALPGTTRDPAAAPAALPGASSNWATAPSNAHDLWIATIEAMPRVVSDLGWQDGGGGPSEPARFAGVTLGSGDIDGDGHGDVKLSLAVQLAPAETPVALALDLFDRPAGLARNPAEPEATITGLANQARGHLRKNTEQALMESGRALALHAALCRETGQARVTLAGVQGLSCGRSRGAGRAASVRAAALAKTGQLLAAIEALQTLDDDAYDVAEADRERAREAVAAHASKELVWRAGPPIAPVERPAVRLAALGFLDEDTLLLRGSTAHSMRIGAERAEPIGMSGDVLVRDPKGGLAAVEIFRSCEGPRVRIVRAEQVVAGIVAGASIAEPLVAAEPPPSPHRCPAPLPAAARNDTAGFRVLDWTDAGLLLSRGATLWRLALDAEGKGQAPAREVAAGDEARAAHPGGLSETGRHLAVATALGIAVIERATGAAMLVPYSGPLEGAAPSAIRDVAVAPSGRRIALVYAGRVHFTVEQPAAPPAEPVAPLSEAPSAPPAPDPTSLPPPAP